MSATCRDNIEHLWQMERKWDVWDMSKQYKMSVTGRNKTTYLGCVNTTLHVGDRF